MRPTILYFTATLLLTLASGGIARADSPDKGVDDPCKQFKMVIATPSKDIDYKIIIIPVPKNLDKAMVVNPCLPAGEIVPTPLIILQPKETTRPLFIQPKEINPAFKFPPFEIRNKYFGSVQP